MNNRTSIMIRELYLFYTEHAWRITYTSFEYIAALQFLGNGAFSSSEMESYTSYMINQRRTLPMGRIYSWWKVMICPDWQLLENCSDDNWQDIVLSVNFQGNWRLETYTDNFLAIGRIMSVWQLPWNPPDGNWQENVPVAIALKSSRWQMQSMIWRPSLALRKTAIFIFSYFYLFLY